MTCLRPRASLWLSLWLPVAPLLAQPATTLDAVEVSATRLQQVDAFDTPASLDRIDLRQDQHQDAMDIRDALASIAGVLARDRQNQAQDTQLSIRGFGARSTFGVRGLRLYVDGIPASMPDGQGQLSHVNLAAADHVEIMRGPFSALYGNSSGGVIQVWSAQGSDPERLQGKISAGSHGSHWLNASALGRNELFGYHLAVAHQATDGYRAHSAARRESAHAKLDFELGSDRSLALVLNNLDIPQALDPLGLSAAEVARDPRQATPVASAYDTRKSVSQGQLGLRYQHTLSAQQTLQVSAYGGQRDVEQFLAIPVTAQNNPLNSGGVVDLDNTYGGVDLRWNWQGPLTGKPFEFTVGTNADRQQQHRRGYTNHANGNLGVRGTLRRDERNQVGNRDQFAQAWWQFSPRWSLLAGLRHSVVTFDSDDHYLPPGNPDDSGHVDFAQTTPVAGVVFKATADTRLYLSAGRGFETPTFNELAYRADGGAGLALDLQPARSRNLELGWKWRNAADASAQLAWFRADTQDELAVASNRGGRSTYRNVGRARRQGLEASADVPLGRQWNLQWAYTWLDAFFRDDFLICTGAGCSIPTTRVAAGSPIPGVARQVLQTRLQWQTPDWLLALESSGISTVAVNDLASESAAGYFLWNLEASRHWVLKRGRLRGFVRIDNLLDRAYIGSVIVNEGNGRYYEPGPDRGLRLGLQWQGSP